MGTLYFELHTGRKIIVLPDTAAHLNGHVMITKSYSIFKDQGFNSPKLLEAKRSEQLLEPLDDPDYLGILRFDLPDKLFTYSAAANPALEPEEVNELIGSLSEIRSDPRYWSTS